MHARARSVLSDLVHLSSPLSPAGSSRYHLVLFDVDSKDSTVGMSCPPRPFVDAAFLASLKDRCLQPGRGMFVLNLVCRDTRLREAVVADLRKLFSEGVLAFKVPEEVNEILFCSEALKNPGRKRKLDPKHPVIEALRRVNEAVRVGGKKNEEEEFVDVAESLKRLNFAV